MAVKTKNKRTGIMIAILLGLLITAYKVMFAPPPDDSIYEETNVSAERVEEVLAKVESINFDTSVLQDEKFNSLKSIETPYISLPTGKQNPFSGNLAPN